MKTKTSMMLFLLSLLFLRATAQPDSRIQKEKMRSLAIMTGTWKGSGSVQRGPGEPQRSDVTEQIHYKLDSTILLIEGLGVRTEPAGTRTVVHEALGVISYDVAKNAYSFRSYLRTGQGTEAALVPVGENNYQWGFDVPQGTIRYTITLDPIAKTWTEIGAFSGDGAQWSKFFEMKLTREE